MFLIFYVVMACVVIDNITAREQVTICLFIFDGIPCFNPSLTESYKFYSWTCNAVIIYFKIKLKSKSENIKYQLFTGLGCLSVIV